MAIESIIARARDQHPERAAQLDAIAHIRRNKSRAGWVCMIAMGLAVGIFSLSPLAAFAVLAGLGAALYVYHAECNAAIREISRDRCNHLMG